MGQRRNFSKEFKLEAVNLVVTRGVSVAQACRDLDVSENVMRRWIREFHSSEGQAFPGHGVQKPNDAELTPPHPSATSRPQSLSHYTNVVSRNAQQSND